MFSRYLSVYFYSNLYKNIFLKIYSVYNKLLYCLYGIYIKGKLRDMPSCIICHMMIYESIDTYYSCINGHPIHEDCLKEWLIHSNNCPLCREVYSNDLIKKFQGYKEQKELEKQVKQYKELKEETLKNMKIIADKMVFLKFSEAIESLIKEKKFQEAFEKLLIAHDNNIDNSKINHILFLLGKVNYFRKKYDLAINFLFKLVKKPGGYDFPDALGLKDKAKWAFDRMT
jgi:tetratricopeptide (TPR) repeat protein